jgi:hypothetical protein
VPKTSTPQPKPCSATTIAEIVAIEVQSTRSKLAARTTGAGAEEDSTLIAGA